MLVLRADAAQVGCSVRRSALPRPYQPPQIEALQGVTHLRGVADVYCHASRQAFLRRNTYEPHRSQALYPLGRHVA